MQDSKKMIEIDLDVHKAIEAERTTFQQSPNEILRGVFGLSPEFKPRPRQSELTKVPRTRKTGAFSFELLGEREVGQSLKGGYLGCLLKLADLDSEFLDRLARETTPARRIVARQKRDLYLRNPRLADDFAERLCDGWWVDTNLSRQQCVTRLEKACRIAGIEFGTDLILDFA